MAAQEIQKLLLFFAITLLFPAFPAMADSLSYETGAGFYFSGGASANFLRYQHEAGQFFGFGSYYEASYAFLERSRSCRGHRPCERNTIG